MSFIDLFFAFFNSGLLFLLFWFVFRKNILPGVEQELYSEKVVREQLGDERTRLAHALTLIDRDREFRDEQYRLLMERVARWVEFEERVRTEQRQELQHNQQRYCERVARQIGYVQVRSIEQEVLPCAVESAESGLCEYFSEDECGRVFIDRAVSSLIGGVHE